MENKFVKTVEGRVKELRESLLKMQNGSKWEGITKDTLRYNLRLLYLLHPKSTVIEKSSSTIQ